MVGTPVLPNGYVARLMAKKDRSPLGKSATVWLLERVNPIGFLESRPQKVSPRD
jgi:hypothetical protein